MTTDEGGGHPPKTPLPVKVPILGVLFIVAGVVFLVGSMFPGATITRLWPLLLLIPAAILGQVYLEKRSAAAGVLVPLGILLYLAVFFLWLNFSSWSHAAVTWPHFLLAPAFGLFLQFLATRNAGLLVPVTVLSVLAAIFLAGFHQSKALVGAVLVGIGIALVLGSALRGRKG